MTYYYETDDCKVCFNNDYNYVFNKNNGMFSRWGKTKEEDPQVSNLSAEILDIEITDICKGPGGKPCKFCYKNNLPTNKHNMSFGVYKLILDKMKKHLTQVAFGVNSSCESNSDIWKMMEYTRECGIIPNTTVADITEETAKKLAKYCGAVSVSRYDNKDICYDSVKRLIDAGLSQCNIHVMISEETYWTAHDTLDDVIHDERLKGLNAVVMLSLKQKGRGIGYHPLAQDRFDSLVNYALLNAIPIGFDSCGARKFLHTIKDRLDFKDLNLMVEPCESSLFSSYINVFGDFFPCSFAEGTEDWIEGLPINEDTDFLNDIWLHPSTESFRKRLLKCNRDCPIYKV